ncbi:hypothetical protein BDN72DRAFT_959871 [Pluteus cervinus]|uniref:Uncharacterized protein n=1 Tax=Pluteus cervinus TaxID=181527 RepID=A0ACD3ATJ8_9AGAR|nr:hypothetical protein BDN72DRAFT_959871 [Pluteus cervinus]
MSFNTSYTTSPPNFVINEEDREVACHHQGLLLDDVNTTHSLCTSCRTRSYNYWSQLLNTWKGTLALAGCHEKLDWVLDYILAVNDLNKAQFPAPLGTYPRLSVVERALGLNEQDINIILGCCPQKPSPIGFAQWDSTEPPFILPQLRSFLTDTSRVQREPHPQVHLRNVNAVHRRLAAVFIRIFFDPSLDEVSEGQEIKAFVGVAWIHHIILSNGFHNAELSRFWRELDMELWFEWVFAEGWRKGMTGSKVVEIDSVNLVSRFVTLFTDVPDSYQLDNIEALDVCINQFLNRHFVQDLERPPSGFYAGVQQFPFRYTSCSFYLNAIHDTNCTLENGLPLPPHLQLQRTHLVYLLSFGDPALGFLEDEGRQRAQELVLADPGIPHDVARIRQAEDIYPVLELTDTPGMDDLFKCGSIFRIWALGDRPAYVWRGRQETHEDLAVCCLEVLTNSEPLRKGESQLRRPVHVYAKYTWSYHLSHSTPTMRLVQLLKQYTNDVASGRSEFHNEYCHHPTLATEWMEEAWGYFPESNLEPLLWDWRRIRRRSSDHGIFVSCATSTSSNSSRSCASGTMLHTPSRKKQKGDRTIKKERPSPYANTKRKVASLKRKLMGGLEGVEEES